LSGVRYDELQTMSNRDVKPSGEQLIGHRQNGIEIQMCSLPQRAAIVACIPQLYRHPADERQSSRGVARAESRNIRRCGRKRTVGIGRCNAVYFPHGRHSTFQPTVAVSILHPSLTRDD